MSTLAVITEAEEWAIHYAVMKAELEHAGEQGWQGRSRQPGMEDLNLHSRLAELAESRGAELHVAKHFGIDYDISENKGKHKADVGAGIEVKWTGWKLGALRAHSMDRETDVYVLVTGKSPNYVIRGWIPVKCARVSRYSSSMPETWYVNQDQLNPIESLSVSEYAYAIG